MSDATSHFFFLFIVDYYEILQNRDSSCQIGELGRDVIQKVGCEGGALKLP